MKRKEFDVLAIIHDNVKEGNKKLDKLSDKVESNTVNISTIQTDLEYVKNNGHGSLGYAIIILKKLLKMN